jgi:hypothetical protein
MAEKTKVLTEFVQDVPFRRNLVQEVEVPIVLVEHSIVESLEGLVQSLGDRYKNLAIRDGEVSPTQVREVVASVLGRIGPYRKNPLTANMACLDGVEFVQDASLLRRQFQFGQEPGQKVVHDLFSNVLLEPAMRIMSRVYTRSKAQRAKMPSSRS